MFRVFKYYRKLGGEMLKIAKDRDGNYITAEQAEPNSKYYDDFGRIV